MKKIALVVMTGLFILFTNAFHVSASGYNYSPLRDVIYSAEAMIVSTVVDSANIKDQFNDPANVSFGALADVFGFEDLIYIVDKSNNAVHVLNKDYQYLVSFGQTDGDGKLSSPEGIFVTEDAIYVADTGNFRVAVFDKDYNYLWEITAPDDPTFKQSPDDPSGYDFKPLKLAVHKTGRVYVIAGQIFEGILDFNPNGTFSRYVGANTVTLSAWEAFWLRFTTEKQRQTQGYRLATTFKNMNIDEMGYLYTVSSLVEGDKVIKKLNYKGIDVLTRNGYISQVGDIVVVPENNDVPSSASEFIDIDVNEFGNYSVLDITRGRIFTYDFEGNLLYVAGQLGSIGNQSSNERDLFMQPKALAYYDNHVLVVDSMNNNLVVFEYTDFGRLVNEATQYYYDGEYSLARDTWEEVLVLNTNYFLAYAGIAKACLREGDFEKAMEYAKLGYDDYTFSSAYQPYRYSKLVDVFPYLVGGTLGLLVYFFGRTIVMSVRKSREEEEHNE